MSLLFSISGHAQQTETAQEAHAQECPVRRLRVQWADWPYCSSFKDMQILTAMDTTSGTASAAHYFAGGQQHCTPYETLIRAK
jgi:hypothetical protein